MTSSGTLRDGILRHARANPDLVAIRLPGRDVTYAELDDTARRWANCLLELCGGRPPARVGLLATRSYTAYAAVVACLYAGAAYVPLSRTFPIARTRRMATQAKLNALIADPDALPIAAQLSGDLGLAPLLAPGVPDAELEAVWPGRSAGQRSAHSSALQVLPPLDASQLAYLLFTSGSTGQPKGVAITHANVRAFLDVNLPRYRLTTQDRLSQTFELTFDLSVFDMFMAWESGASLCTLQPIELLAPAQAVARLGITTWFSVPSVAAGLLRRGALSKNAFPGLRWSLFCGEALPAPVAAAWQDAAPNAVLESLYGPTELTIACAVHRWNADPALADDLVPLGSVYPGLSARILDERLMDVPEGSMGELAIAGPQTSPGYWDNPDETRNRFIDLPNRHGHPERYYRTGDRVVERGGVLHFKGRVDSEVKIGGYRIELGDVETALRIAAAGEGVALAWPPDDTPQGIIGFVLQPSDPTRIQAALASALPPYMLPRSIHAIADMPLNANGKIDRKKLADRFAVQIGPDGRMPTKNSDGA